MDTELFSDIHFDINSTLIFSRITHYGVVRGAFLETIAANIISSLSSSATE